MRLAIGVALLACSSAARAEPCPMFGLASEPLTANVTATPDGGIVVAEVPKMQESAKRPTPERDKWTLKVKGKATEVKQDTIAPGLVVYRPPASATAWELFDGGGKRLAKAALSNAKQPPELLPAPAVRAIISGTSKSIHPSTFVNVELAQPPPKQAVALVLSKAKGAAYSWGKVFAEQTVVSVYSTQSGCVSMFPNGTEIAQPDESVTLFWVDAYGRRSRVSSTIVVEKLRSQ